jgi:hypothetical protein
MLPMLPLLPFMPPLFPAGGAMPPPMFMLPMLPPWPIMHGAQQLQRPSNPRIAPIKEQLRSLERDLDTTTGTNVQPTATVTGGLSPTVQLPMGPPSLSSLNAAATTTLSAVMPAGQSGATLSSVPPPDAATLGNAASAVSNGVATSLAAAPAQLGVNGFRNPQHMASNLNGFFDHFLALMFMTPGAASMHMPLVPSMPMLPGLPGMAVRRSGNYFGPHWDAQVQARSSAAAEALFNPLGLLPQNQEHPNYPPGIPLRFGFAGAIPAAMASGAFTGAIQNGF